MSSTAIIKNRGTDSLFIVTGISNSSMLKEFVEDVAKYFPYFSEELDFSVVAIIDTDNDPLIQTYDNIQSMSVKNFFKSLIKMSSEFVTLVKNSDDAPFDAHRQVKIGLSNLERDISLKF